MSNKEDSDSDSLPDLFRPTTVPKTSISAGDIVWAKYKNLYWPALVRHVYTKEKKITVWYTDDPGKTFKIPLKNVYLFYDHEQRKKIEKEVREAGCVKEHEGITSHASMYLRRKASGYDDDPMKFFDQTYPFFLMEEELKKDPNAASDIKIPHLYITPEKKVLKKNATVRNVKIRDEELNTECVSSDESDSEPKTKDYLLQVKQELSNLMTEDKNIDEIVNFIKSGKADAHLRKIQSNRISSEYHAIFEKSMKCHKKFVSSVTYTGPIENDEKLRDLIFYLLEFHDKPTIVPKNKRYRTRDSKTKFIQYPSSDTKHHTSQYVASVLLPEAIIYAMSQIYKVSLTKAKKLFQKNSESETEKIEKIIATIGSAPSKIAEEVSQEESHNSNLEMSDEKPSKKPRVIKNNSKK